MDIKPAEPESDIIEIHGVIYIVGRGVDWGERLIGCISNSLNINARLIG